MKHYIIQSIFLIFSYQINAQTAETEFIHEKRDYIWLTGYSSNPDFLEVGGTRIDFNEYPINIEYEYRDLNFDVTNTAISDKQGNLLFYTNGISIANANNEVLENGTGLNPSSFRQEWIDKGYPIPQGALMLPFPTNPNKYSLLHTEISYTLDDNDGEFVKPLRLFNTVIDSINSENLFGKVTEKNIVAIEDTLDIGKLTATRHANGRDWWILAKRFYTDEYHRLLLDSSGIHHIGVQLMGDSLHSGVGQAVFSPDGTTFARYDGIEIGGDQFLNIYEFDRCTGLLSNPRHIFIRDSAASIGIAISQNSRFLYASSFDKMYQFDLHADDIEATKDTLGIYDGFASPFSTPFFLAQLAPNDKIYITAPNTVDVLHVIHEPDKKGKACDFEQHGIQLPTLNAYGIPNNPYYGLGPLDGSPCDTLNINNPLPLADFVYDTDSSLLVDFYDKSLYQAENWSWDFGDGAFSEERFPSHTYAIPDLYTVCLTVTSPMGSDTYCQEVNLEVTSEAPLLTTEEGFRIYPNPAKDQFTLEWQEVDQFLINGNLSILNMNGQVVQQEIIQGMQQVIGIQSLAAGVYTIVLTIGKSTIKEKIVIIQ